MLKNIDKNIKTYGIESYKLDTIIEAVCVGTNLEKNDFKSDLVSSTCGNINDFSFLSDIIIYFVRNKFSIKDLELNNARNKLLEFYEKKLFYIENEKSNIINEISYIKNECLFGSNFKLWNTLFLAYIIPYKGDNTAIYMFFNTLSPKEEVAQIVQERAKYFKRIS